MNAILVLFALLLAWSLILPALILWYSGKSQNDKEKLNTIIDRASGVSIFYLIISFILARFSSHASEPLHGHIPLFLWLLIADIVPAVFGICWLLQRHQNAIPQFVSPKWFAILVFILALTINTVLHRLGI
jgi:hypothetical protein